MLVILEDSRMYSVSYPKCYIPLERRMAASIGRCRYSQEHPSPVTRPPSPPLFFLQLPVLEGFTRPQPHKIPDYALGRTAFIVSLLLSPLMPDRPMGWLGTYQNDFPAFITLIKVKKKAAFLGGLPWELPQTAARQLGHWGRWVISGAQGVSRVGWGQGPQEFNA